VRLLCRISTFGSPHRKKPTTSDTSPAHLSPEQPSPPTCHSKSHPPPPPESLPEWMQGEQGARRAVLIVIGAGLADLLVDLIVRRWRR